MNHEDAKNTKGWLVGGLGAGAGSGGGFSGEIGFFSVGTGLAALGMPSPDGGKKSLHAGKGRASNFL